MAKTWVLDTETKGTGANMVPLEKVLEQPSKDDESGPPRRKRAAPRPERRRIRESAKVAATAQDHLHAAAARPRPQEGHR